MNKLSQAWSFFACNLGLVALGSLLFALSFPNFIADWGWAPLAWISLVPMLILIRRVPWYLSPLWGAAYGYASYALFNFWLATFNPLSFVIVPTIYAGWYFLLFIFFSFADRCFPRYGWLVQVLIWTSFEILRTRGILGYNYGILGYSQYSWLSFIAIADIFGVMGVSILVAFPSFLLAWYLMDGAVPKGLAPRRAAPSPKISHRRWGLFAGIWLLLMTLANIYGWISKVDYSKAPSWRPALIQHNVNTWMSSTKAWSGALDSLIKESKRALKDSPDALIWSETAFVPAIEWHERYRRSRERINLIHRLKKFLKTVELPVLLGNNDALMAGGERVDYNAVLQFDRGEIVNKYRKIHLVPFSEYFPYSTSLPRLKNYIDGLEIPSYQQGTEHTIFSLNEGKGPKLGLLICFEDTFGYLSRGSVLAGAEVLVNVTNDSWSPEAASAIQHQNMAVFRAVENRRSLVRATTAGLSSVIDPNGKILAKLEPYTTDYLIQETPVFTGRRTLYTRWGNWFENFLLILSLPIIFSTVILALSRFIKTPLRRQKTTRKDDNFKKKKE